MKIKSICLILINLIYLQANCMHPRNIKNLLKLHQLNLIRLNNRYSNNSHNSLYKYPQSTCLSSNSNQLNCLSTCQKRFFSDELSEDEKSKIYGQIWLAIKREEYGVPIEKIYPEPTPTVTHRRIFTENNSIIKKRTNPIFDSLHTNLNKMPEEFVINVFFDAMFEVFLLFYNHGFYRKTIICRAFGYDCVLISPEYYPGINIEKDHNFDSDSYITLQNCYICLDDNIGNNSDTIKSIEYMLSKKDYQLVLFAKYLEVIINRKLFRHNLYNEKMEQFVEHLEKDYNLKFKYPYGNKDLPEDASIDKNLDSTNLKENNLSKLSDKEVIEKFNAELKIMCKLCAIKSRSDEYEYTFSFFIPDYDMYCQLYFLKLVHPTHPLKCSIQFFEGSYNRSNFDGVLKLDNCFIGIVLDNCFILDDKLNDLKNNKPTLISFLNILKEIFKRKLEGHTNQYPFGGLY